MDDGWMEYESLLVQRHYYSNRNTPIIFSSSNVYLIVLVCFSPFSSLCLAMFSSFLYWSLKNGKSGALLPPGGLAW